MPIEGNTSALPTPLKTPGFVVSVVRFSSSRNGEAQPVSTVDELRAILAPYSTHEQLAVYLDRDGGDSGSVWVLINGDRAQVAHMTEPGGIDSYCRDIEYDGPDQTVGFLLDNGQLDEFHWCCTIARAEGLKGLEYFLQHGDRDPSLNWVEEPQSPFSERPK